MFFVQSPCAQHWESVLLLLLGKRGGGENEKKKTHCSCVQTVPLSAQCICVNNHTPGSEGNI